MLLLLFYFFLGRFDVHRDTIIRTEESRSMGAKFLDNADLGSREECLRLCCETDGCDVFVFEEKVKYYNFFTLLLLHNNKKYVYKTYKMNKCKKRKERIM